MYRKKVHIHFLGIGGIGMSGIAKILKSQGYKVSGCDLDTTQQTVLDLNKIGCQISNKHNSSLCQDKSVDVLVYSSVISEDNPEVQFAKNRGIPIIPRALMLAELMRTKHGIAIAGAHGKTTTTSMVSQILIEADTDPTVIIGGRLKSISTNAQLGNGDFLVAEADESDRSLLHLQATLAVITNIDLEHLETYKDLNDIKDTFKKFLNNLPFYGKAIVCVDSKEVRSLFPMPQIKLIKYGIDYTNPNDYLCADIYATNINLMPSSSEFNVNYQGKLLGVVKINVPGKHNILNSLAAIAVSFDLGIPFQQISRSLQNFHGVDRRFSYHGTFKGAEIFDDYGHHPVEIDATLKVAKLRSNGKVHVVFQPHRYSRTQKLWNDFVNTFSNKDIDHLIITDIYAASEQPIDRVDSKKLVAEIQVKNPSLKVTYLPMEKEFDQIINKLNQTLLEKDLLLLLGAGRINQIADILVK